MSDPAIEPLEKYEEVFKRMLDHVENTYIYPRRKTGTKRVLLDKCTVQDFVIWAVQAWPPLKNMFKKKLPAKKDFEHYFVYIVNMHSSLTFPKGSMNPEQEGDNQEGEER